MDPLLTQEVGPEILFSMSPQEEDFLEGAVLKYYADQLIIWTAFYRQVRECIQLSSS